jgi:hypothetical protein
MNIVTNRQWNNTLFYWIFLKFTATRDRNNRINHTCMNMNNCDHLANQLALFE